MHRIRGQNPCCASFFASVYLKQMVEFNRPPCRTSFSTVNSSICSNTLRCNINHSQATAPATTRITTPLTPQGHGWLKTSVPVRIKKATLIRIHCGFGSETLHIILCRYRYRLLLFLSLSKGIYSTVD